jgi:hypothetical protein
VFPSGFFFVKGANDISQVLDESTTAIGKTKEPHFLYNAALFQKKKSRRSCQGPAALSSLFYLVKETGQQSPFVR